MSLSLLSSINTCKVNTSYADKLQSDRYENPENMTCFVWNGLDNYGRPVSADSYYTKAAGCNDALDRVVVENFQRPRYMEYVSLDARGIKGSNEAPVPKPGPVGPVAPIVQSRNTQARRGPVAPAHLRENFYDPLQENFVVGPPNNTAASSAGRQVQNYYKIVGSAGADYMANNTPRISGQAGANGNPNAYMSCGCSGRENSNGGLMEGYTPDISANNFQRRQTQSAIANYKSNLARTASGILPNY